MRRQDAEIPAPGGLCHGTLHIPGGDGPGPASWSFPTRAGCGRRSGGWPTGWPGLGYVVLVPDIYYRAGARGTVRRGHPVHRRSGAGPDGGPGGPGDQRPDHRRFRGLRGLPAGPPGGARARDRHHRLLPGRAHVTARRGRDRARGSPRRPRSTAAGWRWPATRSSPHLLAGQITATVYVAGATDDSHFTAEQAELLHSALAAAGTEHTRQTYPAKHGFAVPDNPTYDPAAEARHWAALERPTGPASRARPRSGRGCYPMWRRTARAWFRPWIRPTSHSAMSSAAAAPWLVTRRPSTT